MNRLLLIVSLIFMLTPSSFSEEVTFGFYKEELWNDYFSKEKNSSAIMRELVGLTLTQKTDSAPGFRLYGASTIKGNPENYLYQVSLKPGLRFHSNNLVEIEDAIASLKYCQRKGIIPESLSLEENSNLEIELRIPPSAMELFASIPSSLSSCVLFPKELIEFFGQELSSGTGFVSAGAYAIENFKPGGQLTLLKWGGLSSSEKRADRIHFRSFDDPLHAVTALRLGTIAAFWPPSSHPGLAEAVQRAQEDKTLEITSCWGDTVIARRGLQFSCESGKLLKSLSLERFS